MDIIYFLANHGVPVTEKDSTGHTPFDKATLLDEINFMEGAVLLGGCHCCCCCVVHTYYLLNDCVMFMFADVLSQIQQRRQSEGGQMDGTSIGTDFKVLCSVMPSLHSMCH